MKYLKEPNGKGGIAGVDVGTRLFATMFTAVHPLVQIANWEPILH